MYTGVQLAAAGGHLKVMELLVKRGAAWTERDDWGWTVLHEVMDYTVLYCTLLCYMELRKGDVAKNQNIRSSRGAAEYSLTFEMAYGGLVRSPDRSALVGLSIGLSRPAGEFEKQNCTRPPGSTISKVKMYKAAPREDRIF